MRTRPELFAIGGNVREDITTEIVLEPTTNFMGEVENRKRAKVTTQQVTNELRQHAF